MVLKVSKLYLKALYLKTKEGAETEAINMENRQKC